MKRTGFTSRIRSLLMVVAILATSVVGAVAATPSIASALSCDCVKTSLTADRAAYGGNGLYLSFNWNNDSDQTWTDAKMSVTLPEGINLGFNPWNNGDYDPATRKVTGEPRLWNGSSVSNTIEPWMQESDWLSVDVDPSVAGTTVALRYEATFVDSNGLKRTNINVLNLEVLERGADFDQRIEASFSPASTDYEATSTLTVSVHNDGPGFSGSAYAVIDVENELEITSAIPADCHLDEGTYYHYIYCDELAPEGGFAPGLLATWTFTVKAPAAPLPVSVESETFEAEASIGCGTSGAAGGEEINEDNNEASALLTVPPSPAGQLAVVRNLPAFIDQPGVVTNPTAGRSMTSSVDVFNVGNAAVDSAITVVIAPTAGFTPTSISATSEDSTTPAPSCVLATLTCTFSHLGAGQKARIVLTGDLAPTIADGTAFSSSVTVSADGFDPATDTDTTKIAALAEGIISISSVSHASPGEQVDYGVTVINRGPSTMVNPVATLALPAGMTIVDLPDICTQSGSTVTCTLPGSLEPGQDYSFGFTAGLPDEVGDHQVTATLSSDTPLADASVTDADHLVATATTVTDLVEAGGLPYTGSNSGTLALIGAGLALGGLILVSATGRIATRRRND
jgi:uncharacterized repeat protein (TIGR01451 family)